MFTLDATDYPCVVHYYSGYFEVDKLKSKTTPRIAKKLSRNVSVRGIPNQLICDSMPFSSQDFRSKSLQLAMKCQRSMPFLRTVVAT